MIYFSDNPVNPKNFTECSNKVWLEISTLKKVDKTEKLDKIGRYKKLDKIGQFEKLDNVKKMDKIEKLGQNWTI